MALATSLGVPHSDDKPSVLPRMPRRAPAAASRRVLQQRNIPAILAGLAAISPALAAGTLPAAGPAGFQSLDEVTHRAEATVRAALPRPVAGPGSSQQRILARSPDPRLRLADCANEPTGSLPAGSASLRGRALVQVSCSGPVRWSVLVPVSIESELDVLVARRTLPRGAVPTAADVEVRHMTLPGFADTYISNLEQLSGSQLSRPLAAGAALTRDTLAAGPVVRRGESVTLVTDLGGLQVRAPGLALADARPGERVRAQNVNSLKVVEGRADTQGMIEVDR